MKTEICLFDHQPHTLSFQEESLSPVVSPAFWLASQTLYPKVYFKDKKSNTVRASAGMSLSFPHPPFIQGSQDIRLYGGQHFFPSHGKPQGIWSDFPKSCYWLPVLELSTNKESSLLRRYTTTSSFSQLPLLEQHSFPSIQTSYTPDYHDWEINVEKALDAIQKKQLNKVVLARKTSQFFETSPCPFAKLLQLEQEYRSGTLFFFQFEPNSAFLGLTPEHLYTREGSTLHIEAIAGTRKNPHSFTSKERKEFICVKEAIERLLTPLSISQKWQEQDTVIQAKELYHLYNKLTAEIHLSLSDREILQLLHPTPALGGDPQKKACDLIQELETFERGWYGAPVGVLSQNKSSFAVAIRSALFHHNQIDLFTGAGIVDGSLAKQEWEELDAKLSWFSYTEND